MTVSRKRKIYMLVSRINVHYFAEPLTPAAFFHCELLNPRGHCHTQVNMVLDTFAKQLMLLILMGRTK